MAHILPMTVAELMPLSEPRGRRSNAFEVRYAGEVGESDLALLAGSRGTKPHAVKQLRDRHHALARAIASGMGNVEASAVTGYDPARISVLKGDPAFKELVSHYQTVKESAFAEFQDRAAAVAIEALNQIAEELEERPEEVSLSQKMDIVVKLADRTGNAPVSRNITANVNIDLGDRLVRARQRASTVIEGQKINASD